MTDPAAFLRARLAEDERAALAAVRGWAGVRVESVTEAEAVHISRYDPARALAEVAAKLLILAEHGPRAAGAWSTRAICGRCVGLKGGWQAHPCPTLRALALPYAGHPDYRQEWAP